MTQKVPIIKEMDREGRTTNHTDVNNGISRETCGTVKGLFNMFSKHFRLQHNETILLLQYC